MKKADDYPCLAAPPRGKARQPVRSQGVPSGCQAPASAWLGSDPASVTRNPARTPMWALLTPAGLRGAPSPYGPRLSAGLRNPGGPSRPQLDRGARNTTGTETFLSWFAASILQPLRGAMVSRAVAQRPPRPLVQSPLLSPHYASGVLPGPRSLWRPRPGPAVREAQGHHVDPPLGSLIQTDCPG